jgi:S1-C subfamily serine protease
VALAGTGVSACATSPGQADKVIPVNITAAPVVSASVPAAGSTNSIVQTARQYVFRVRNESCLEVGTAFAADGEIVTNRHVAAGATTLDMATWDGQDFTSQVAQHDDSEDLALIDGVPPEEAYGTLATADPTPGTPVWVAGYPLGDQLTVVSGKVLGEFPGDNYGLRGPVLQISDPIQHGNSGSPLLDASGDIVGVVFAIDTRTNDGLAMPVSSLRALVKDGNGDSNPLPCTDLSP